MSFGVLYTKNLEKLYGISPTFCSKSEISLMCKKNNHNDFLLRIEERKVNNWSGKQQWNTDVWCLQVLLLGRHLVTDKTGIELNTNDLYFSLKQSSKIRYACGPKKLKSDALC